MRTQLAQLRTNHEELLAAIDGGEAERMAELVASRSRLIEELGAALTAAPASERAAVQPELNELLVLDRDLQGRASAVRDQLGRHLDRQRGSRSHPTPPPTITGILDRQA